MIKYTNENWKSELTDFKMWYSQLFDEMVEWYPISKLTVGFTLPDGVRRGFNAFHTNLYIFIYDKRFDDDYWHKIDLLYSKEYISEDKWKSFFATFLCRYMDYAGMGVEYLANQTGISAVTISRSGTSYIVPSLYNATKMTRALRCSLSDFYVPNNQTIDIRKLRTNDEWDELIDRFKDTHPDIAEDVLKWWPIGTDEFMVKLSDNTKLLFNCYDLNYIVVYDPHYDDGPYMTEAEWRIRFSKILRDIMYSRDITQTELASSIGLTQPMLNRYLKGKATPSLYNATKMARVLSCSLAAFKVY